MAQTDCYLPLEGFPILVTYRLGLKRRHIGSDNPIEHIDFLFQLFPAL